MHPFRMLLIMILIVAGCLTFTGCISTQDQDPKQISYSVGRTAVVAYLITKDKLTLEQQETVAKMWKIFDMMVSTINDQSPGQYEKLLLAEINKKITDKKQAMMATELVTQAILKLKRSVEFSKIDK